MFRLFYMTNVLKGLKILNKCVKIIKNNVFSARIQVNIQYLYVEMNVFHDGNAIRVKSHYNCLWIYCKNFPNGLLIMIMLSLSKI